jgi:hypothetical protein
VWEAFEDPNCFRLARRHTDFDGTTERDLRLLFLTTPLFQGERQRRGQALFSNTFPITATDSRGY